MQILWTSFGSMEDKIGMKDIFCNYSFKDQYCTGGEIEKPNIVTG